MNLRFWPFRPLSWLLATVLVIAIPPGSAVESSPREHSSQSTTEDFQSLADLLQYISVDWDRLTRSLASCATYLDRKEKGEKTLYLPADSPAPASLTLIP